MNPEEYRVMAELEGVQWWYAGMRRIARALLEPLLPEAGSRSRRILDAGCGTGWNLQALSVFGETHGVDLSPLAASATRRRGGRVSLGNLLSLPYGSASFDVVTSFDVIYHAWVVDDVQAVRELARVLKPGGVLLLKAPALKILWGAHDEAVLSRHRYTRPEMESPGGGGRAHPGAIDLRKLPPLPGPPHEALPRSRAQPARVRRGAPPAPAREGVRHAAVDRGGPPRLDQPAHRRVRVRGGAKTRRIESTGACTT
jgi:SAM-dependent methyltransferase